MSRAVRAAASGLALVLLAGCGTPAPDRTPMEADAGAAAAAEYVVAVEAHRRAREERLTGEYDWLSLVGLHWLEPGENSFGSGHGNAVVLPAGAAPERAGSFRLEDSVVAVSLAPGVAMTLDEASAAGARFEETADGDYGPLQLGRLRLHVIRREGRTAIRVRDPEGPARLQFHGIDYYPVDPGYRVVARLERFATPMTAPFPNAQGWVTEVEVPGEVVFEVGGRTLRLLAQATDDPDEMFLIFKDETSADETYAAGRYLYTEQQGEEIIVDFNKSYNPPCAFTPFATCSYPPPRNRLPVRIEAGERRYDAH